MVITHNPHPNAQDTLPAQTMTPSSSKLATIVPCRTGFSNAGLADELTAPDTRLGTRVNSRAAVATHGLIAGRHMFVVGT